MQFVLYLGEETSAVSVATGLSAKELGAYYTDSQVADLLTSWAVRRSTDTVCDPSFGGGVFLRAACKRIAGLGGDAFVSVHGVEIDSSVHGLIGGKLISEFSLNPLQLVNADFFSLSPGRGQFDAIVGNPPFIRFHRFAGDGRQRALDRAAEAGVTLSKLASSWAPFLVHASGMLAPGGRLAMVVPAEIGYATYAGPVLKYLGNSFGQVSLLTFRQRLFPELNEETYLLLAEDFGGTSSLCQVINFRDVSEACHEIFSSDTTDLDISSLNRKELRFAEAFLSAQARDLYSELRNSPSCVRLGDCADVGIGYVTGANEFFHLSEQEARQRGITEEFLRPAVLRAGGFNGTTFRVEDWRASLKTKNSAYLLMIPPKAKIDGPVRRYLDEGLAAGVNLGYKCRNRKPWYSVPHVNRAGGFLSYMSGDRPRLVVNSSGAVAPNTLHVLNSKPGGRLSLEHMTSAWYCSLARLSIELEGHALGGGMLKLEPSEAERVLMPLYVARPEFLNTIDRLVRQGNEHEARQLADEVILRQCLGLTASQCQVLSDSADELASRRTRRTAAA